MKQFLFFVIISSLMLFTSCSDRYIRNVIRSGEPECCDIYISYYMAVTVNYANRTEEILIMSEAFNSLLTDTSMYPPSSKEVLKIYNSIDSILYLDTNVYWADPFYFEIHKSSNRDSLFCLQTDTILNRYFDDDLRLKKEDLSELQQKDIIYVLVKRRKYVLRYYTSESIYNEVFYGKRIERNGWGIKEPKRR